jgi:hypothetical protein
MIKQDVATEAQEAALINTVLEMRYHRQVAPALSAEILRRLSADPSAAPGWGKESASRVL